MSESLCALTQMGTGEWVPGPSSEGTLPHQGILEAGVLLLKLLELVTGRSPIGA